MTFKIPTTSNPKGHVHDFNELSDTQPCILRRDDLNRVHSECSARFPSNSLGFDANERTFTILLVDGLGFDSYKAFSFMNTFNDEENEKLFKNTGQGERSKLEFFGKRARPQMAVLFEATDTTLVQKIKTRKIDTSFDARNKPLKFVKINPSETKGSLTEHQDKMISYGKSNFETFDSQLLTITFRTSVAFDQFKDNMFTLSFNAKSTPHQLKNLKELNPFTVSCRTSAVALLMKETVFKGIGENKLNFDKPSTNYIPSEVYEVIAHEVAAEDNKSSGATQIQDLSTASTSTLEEPLETSAEPVSVTTQTQNITLVTVATQTEDYDDDGDIFHSAPTTPVIDRKNTT